MTKNFSEDDLILITEFIRWYFVKQLPQQDDLQEEIKYLENLIQSKIQNFTDETYEKITNLLVEYLNNDCFHKPIKNLFKKLKVTLNIVLSEYKLLLQI